MLSAQAGMGGCNSGACPTVVNGPNASERAVGFRPPPMPLLACRKHACVSIFAAMLMRLRRHHVYINVSIPNSRILHGSFIPLSLR